MAAQADALAFIGGLNLSKMAGPVLVILILGMMILPLPPFLLDLLFTFNMAMSQLRVEIAVKPVDLLRRAIQ